MRPRLHNGILTSVSGEVVMGKLGVMGVALACAVAGGCSGGSTAGRKGTCASAADCTKGEVCVSGTCSRACNSDGDCAQNDVCIAGACQARSPECQTDADCNTPSPCELRSSGARCNAGVCDYQPVVCQQTAPVNPCLARTAQCDPTLQQGTCTGTACCAYAPVVTTGSPGPAPACPLSGQDPNGNGSLDSGEQWTGTCTSDGSCTAPVGTACTAATDCTTGLCEDGYCCDTSCDGNCDRCDVSGSEGTCTPDPTLCTGSCATCGSAGNCAADATACSGDCATCQQASTTEFDCSADASQCTALCTSCSGGGSTYSCAYDASRSAADCGAGYACNAADTCLALVGTACGSTSDCAGDLVCSGSPSTCRAPDGDACSAASQCVGGGCTPSGVCCGGAGDPCWRSLAVSESVSCAVAADGTVWCWGDDTYGQLGDGDPNLAAKTTPVQVVGLSNAVKVTAGRFHVCALLDDATVSCWGYDVDGQLGDSAAFANQSTPVPVINLPSGVAVVSAGNGHTCAALKDGTAWCWGLGYYGELGNADPANANQALPVQVSNLTGVTDISAGGYHTCAATNGYKAYCWGYNDYGQLGNGATSTSPQNTRIMVKNLTNVASVSVGRYFSCAVLTNGIIDCWGMDADGELGNDAAFADQYTPVQVTGVYSPAAFSARGYHSCVVLSAGTAQCWGLGSFGQLGNDSANVNEPTPVAVANLSTIGVIAAGSYHTCAGLIDGSAWCWGGASYGQLGNGTFQPSQSLPVQVGFGKKGFGASCSGAGECATQLCVDPFSTGDTRCWEDGATCNVSYLDGSFLSGTRWQGVGKYQGGQLSVQLSAAAGLTSNCTGSWQPGTTVSGCDNGTTSMTGVTLVLDNAGCHLQDSTGADLSTPGSWR